MRPETEYCGAADMRHGHNLKHSPSQKAAHNKDTRTCRQEDISADRNTLRAKLLLSYMPMRST